MVLILHNASQLVSVCPILGESNNPLGIIENASLVMKHGQIHWLGKASDLNLADYPNKEIVDCSGKIILPGLIDSHTHPVFAGNRANEFEMRIQGKTYVEIAQAGGGIQNTVKATRAASESELFELAKARLCRMLEFGVTTVEAKSGYGLSWESELKSLKVIQKLKQTLPMTVQATYMGAHDIPPEFKENPEAYVSEICEQQLPEIAKLKLADYCDVFCEVGYFSVEQARRILETAKLLGLGIKIHAEEFNDIGGAVLAGELSALSADHLLHISDQGIQALKQGGTVATLLPGTAFYLRVSYAPARKILDAGATVALATDFNPGSCMTENLQLVMTLACMEMRMTPVEVLQAVTLNAAKALGLEGDRGSLTVGKRADVLVADVTSYQELLYHYGINFIEQVYVAGRLVSKKQPALCD